MLSRFASLLLMIGLIACSGFGEELDIMQKEIKERLIKAGWSTEASQKLIENKLEYFIFLKKNYAQSFEDEIVIMERMGKYPELVEFVQNHPESYKVLAESIQQEIVAKSLKKDRYYPIIENLYLDYAGLGEKEDEMDESNIDKIALAFLNNREVICRLLERGYEGAEQLFIFSKDLPGSREYERWLQDVLNTFLSYSDDHLDACVVLLLSQGPLILQKLNREKDFRDQMMPVLWPRLKSIVVKKPDFFKYYLVELNVWNVLGMPYGTELLQQYGILPIQLFCGKNAYPKDLWETVAQALLKGDLTTLEALEEFGHEPMFLNLFRRKLSPETIASICNELLKSGSDYRDVLNKYSSVSDHVAAEKAGTAPPNIFESNPLTDGIATVAEKIWENRWEDIGFEDIYKAFEDGMVFYTAIKSSAQLVSFTMLGKKSYAKGMLQQGKTAVKNLEGKEKFYPKGSETLQKNRFTVIEENKIRGFGRQHRSKPDYIAIKENRTIIGEIKSPRERPTQANWRIKQPNDTTQMASIREKIKRAENAKEIEKNVGGHVIVIEGQIKDYAAKIERTYHLPEEAAGKQIMGGYTFPASEVDNVEKAFQYAGKKVLERYQGDSGDVTFIYSLN